MRNQIATEMWEALNRFHLDVQRPGRRRGASARAPRAPRASACRSSSSASSCRASPTRRCRARRAGTSCRPASSSSAPSGPRACSTSTTACSSATTPRRGDREALASAAVRRAALGDAPALALGLRVVPPHLEHGHPAERRDRAADAVAGAAALDPVLGRPRSRPRCATSRRRRRATTARSRCPARRVESNARREIGRLHAELAYQRLNDLFEQGLHRIAARGAAALLPHRRVHRGRVLRPPAADRAGGDGVRYRICHRTSYRYEQRGLRELQRGAAAAARLRDADPARLRPGDPAAGDRDRLPRLLRQRRARLRRPLPARAARDRGDERRRHARGRGRADRRPGRRRARRSPCCSRRCATTPRSPTSSPSSSARAPTSCSATTPPRSRGALLADDPAATRARLPLPRRRPRALEPRVPARHDDRRTARWPRCSRAAAASARTSRTC